ncbi:MAG TPA: hypothetical protein VM573_04485 [Actinomycetota bacterium]|jgi:hypothetical protein|nr:hypothetical protein [Actinomycetota bacterium]
MSADLLQLEAAIRELPHVLGCVIFSGPDGAPSEVQAFTSADADRAAVERSIAAEIAARGVGDSVRRVFVFELEADSLFGDTGETDASSVAEGSLEEADRQPDAGRPVLQQVELRASEGHTVAEVVVGGHSGRAEGRKTTHGLRVLAEATLDAVSRLTGRSDLVLEGAAVASTTAGEAVIVFVRVGDDRLVGAAPVREGALAEVAVRATLDAVNRKLGTAS